MGVKNDGVGTNRTTKHNKLVFWPLCVIIRLVSHGVLDGTRKGWGRDGEKGGKTTY